MSRRPTGSRSWSGTTSYSGSPTLRSSGSTVRSQSARPTARPQDWRHWPRSTNTSRGAKRSPRTSTRRTAISNSLPASMPTQLATHPTSQNATIRRAKQRDSTSTCNTTDDLGAGVKMTATWNPHRSLLASRVVPTGEEPRAARRSMTPGHGRVACWPRRSQNGWPEPRSSGGEVMFRHDADVPDLVPQLSRGKHRSPRKGACFMELASYLAGERWSDRPACTHPLLASLARLVNDHTSDGGRGRLVTLVPSVIGLVSDDPHVDVEIALRSATTALPVASAERQRALAVSVLAAERVRADLDGRPARSLEGSSRAALAQVPHAAQWAERFYREMETAPKDFRRTRHAKHRPRSRWSASLRRACLTPTPCSMTCSPPPSETPRRGSSTTGIANWPPATRDPMLQRSPTVPGNLRCSPITTLGCR